MARKKKEEVVITTVTQEEVTEIIKSWGAPAQEEVPVAPKAVNPVEHFNGYSVEWFKSEKDAMAFHKIVRERGDTFKGGKLDGMSCGREDSLDRDGMFAVTFQRA